MTNDELKWAFGNLLRISSGSVCGMGIGAVTAERKKENQKGEIHTISGSHFMLPLYLETVLMLSQSYIMRTIIIILLLND